MKIRAALSLQTSGSDVTGGAFTNCTATSWAPCRKTNRNRKLSSVRASSASNARNRPKNASTRVQGATSRKKFFPITRSGGKRESADS